MSVEVKTKINDPLAWMQDYGDWDLISDYTDSGRYGYLDTIYHYLVDGMNFDEKVINNKTKDELEEEYNNGFPLLIAESFENVAKDIRSGELVINTDFKIKQSLWKMQE